MSPDELIKESQVESSLMNLRMHLMLEGIDPEAIGEAFQKESFKMFVKYVRLQYEGITTSLIIKLFCDCSRTITEEYFQKERR